MKFWCSLCQVISLHHPEVKMPECSDEAVIIIDGNSACEEHWPLLRGQTVTDALKRLIAQQGLVQAVEER